MCSVHAMLLKFRLKLPRNLIYNGNTQLGFKHVLCENDSAADKMDERASLRMHIWVWHLSSCFTIFHGRLDSVKARDKKLKAEHREIPLILDIFHCCYNEIFDVTTSNSSNWTFVKFAVPYCRDIPEAKYMSSVPHGTKIDILLIPGLVHRKVFEHWNCK